MPIKTINGEFKDEKHYIEFLEASIVAMVKNNNRKCDMIAEVERNGETTYNCSKCKEKHIFMCGTPEDNNFHYCSSCGSKIEKVIDVEEEE